MTPGGWRDRLSLGGLRRRLGRGTSTQLVAVMAVVAALALTGSLYVTGAAVRTDQREQAALAALDDYGSMVQKLGIETGLGSATLTEGDTAFLAGWLATFQSGNARGARTLEETCRTGRGGAGVRYIRSPVGPPVGLAALATTQADRAPGLGEDVYVIALAKGVLCPDRAVEVVAVRRPVGPLDIIVGRVVDRSGEAWVFETIRLDRLATAAAELYEPLAEERGAAIRVVAEPVEVLGVRSLLQRAITNLVDNAVKFSPEGGLVTLTVARRGDRPFLSVADQGPGFAPEALSDPAVAVSIAVAQGRESHGMGLAFVRTILKRHGAIMTIGDAAPGAVVTAQFSR